MTFTRTRSTGGDINAFMREVVMPGLSVTEPALEAKSSRFLLECRSSVIHRWGVFAAEDIPSRRRVIEYTGERINAREVLRRKFRVHLYVFWLDENWALDGAFGGSGAEFINHSCDPNLTAFATKRRIFLSSNRSILSGEELTLDYKTDEGIPRPCACGAVTCRGQIYC